MVNSYILVKRKEKEFVNNDGVFHHKGESKIPPTPRIKDFHNKRGFKAKWL